MAAAGAAAAAGLSGGESFTKLKLAGGRADGCVRLFAPARFGGLSLFTYSTAGPGPAEAGAVDPNLAAAGPGARGAAAGAQARGSEAEGPTVVADEGAAAEPRSVGGARGVEAVLRPRTETAEFFYLKGVPLVSNHRSGQSPHTRERRSPSPNGLRT